MYPYFYQFLEFFQGLQSYYRLKRLKSYYISLHILRGYVYSFCQIFQRLRLFKGQLLFRTLEYVRKFRQSTGGNDYYYHMSNKKSLDSNNYFNADLFKKEIRKKKSIKKINQFIEKMC